MQVLGEALLQERPELVRGRRGVARALEKGHQPLPAGVSCAVAMIRWTAGVALEGRLDLARLDAEAADLDLVVDPAEELEGRRPRARGRDRRCGRGALRVRR